MLHRSRLSPSPPVRWALLVACLLCWSAGRPLAAGLDKSRDFAPGFGLLMGQGETDDGGATRRFGFTSRRLRENERIGSLALVAEEIVDGVPFGVLSDTVVEDDVKLRIQSVFAEMKRYFEVSTGFLYYWGLRGGYTRLEGEVKTSNGETKKFRKDSVAPLALLALPLALENPAFLLLAFADGASMGMVLDITPQRVWLDLQIGASILPRYRDSLVTVEEPFLLTRTLQLVIVF